MNSTHVELIIISLFILLFLAIMGMYVCEYLDLFCKKYEAADKDEEN